MFFVRIKDKRKKEKKMRIIDIPIVAIL